MGWALNRITALVFVHAIIVLGLGSGLGIEDRSVSPPMALGISYFATAFGDCGLLAFWLGVGHGTCLTKVSTSVLGAVYLCLVSVFAFQAWRAPDQIILPSVVIFGCIASLAAVLHVASRWRPGFRLVREHVESLQFTADQFSLRHLFMFMAVVSVALASSTIMRSLLDKAGQIASVVLISGLIIVCFVEAILVAIWASLGEGRMLVRITAAIGLATTTGLIPPFYFEGQLRDYAITVGITTLSQVVTVASLLVVRSAGYRLVQRRSSTVGFEAPSEFLGHPLD